MATFGYNTVGATISNISVGVIAGTLSVLPVEGVISSLSLYIVSHWTSGDKVKGGIYDSSGNYLNYETEEISTGLSLNSWNVFNFVSPPTLAAGSYYLVFWSDRLGGVNTMTIGADTGSSNQLFDTSGQTYPTWVNGLAHTSTSIKSIYATYTATSNIKSYNTNVKANIKSINTNVIANVKSLNTNP